MGRRTVIVAERVRHAADWAAARGLSPNGFIVITSLEDTARLRGMQLEESDVFYHETADFILGIEALRAEIHRFMFWPQPARMTEEERQIAIARLLRLRSALS